MSGPLLEVENLRTYLSERGDSSDSAPPIRAVDGVSFKIERGEAVGIVGESGCGKTITSLSLMGLLPPSARILPGSSIRFEGEELVGADRRRMRGLRGNDIAMIFQEPMTSLNPVLTIGSQVMESLRMRRGPTMESGLALFGGSDSRGLRGMAASLLHEVGLPNAEKRLDDYPHQLSGGMRQRVMIAMALSCEPGLLIADEPTTALDVTVQAQILDLLTELRLGRKMALLLITHDLGVVAEVCERIVVMYAGQVVETGRIEDIFYRPRHPYTKGLLNSLPSGRPLRRLEPIEGDLPDPRNFPQGCRFRERCPLAYDACGEPPPLVGVEGKGMEASGVSSRCWLEQSREPIVDRSPSLR